jgi:hypothetical protein
MRCGVLVVFAISMFRRTVSPGRRRIERLALAQRIR